ncbi:GNAT domain [Phaffia rhodozyma]|uniref:GNAT domain n=1 Tax=Phaffia rhodozyma TaxID=264483 RepID=A0A0F7SRM1_PHARH|nr:GNAT domain [Phaffia rhodozyma]
MTTSELTYRRARLSDEPELIKLRISCGWGEDKIGQVLKDSVDGKLALYLFELEGEPIGMGAIEFEPAGEPDIVNPDTNTVMISLLHIYTRFQGKHLGTKVMDIIEDLCVREFGAKTITLNTRPRLEDGRVNHVKIWYNRRGYNEYKAEEPRYKWGDRLLTACFLRKVVG